MRKITLLFVFFLFSPFFGCKGDVETADFPAQKFLAIDATRPADSHENAAICREAIERMDPYVTHHEKKETVGGEFIPGEVTAAKLNMSEELFEALKSVMQYSNDMLILI